MLESNVEIAELLLTTCESSSHTAMISLWDYNSSNLLKTYKSAGTAVAKTLHKLGNDYLLVAEKGKPLLHVWPINGPDVIKELRMILPDQVNAVAISPDNVYLAAGIGPKLYLWQLSSGVLFDVQQSHLQPITCVKFSQDGSILLAASEEGSVVAYHWGSEGGITQMYKRMDHSMPIRDLYIGSFGLKARFATASSDHTCRVYDLLTGDTLLALVFDEEPTSVLLDAPGWNMFVGFSSGRIQQINLLKQGHRKQRLEFLSHTKRVNCLCLSFTGLILVSGSDDNNVCIWDIERRQALGMITQKGPVTNLMFTFSCKNMFAQVYKPKVVVKPLKRKLDAENRGDYEVGVIQNQNVEFKDSNEMTVCSVSERNYKIEDRLALISAANEVLMRRLHGVVSDGA